MNRSERNRTLTPREDTVAAAVAMGVPLGKVCKKYRLSRTTLWNWLTYNEAFRARVDELRRQAIDTAMGQLSSLLALATKAYRDILSDPATPARLKKETADSVIERAVGLMNFAQMKPEIDELESRESLPKVRGCGT